MTRRRKRRGPREPSDRGPVVYVSDLDILAHEPLVRRIARSMGVAERHVPDVVQSALFSAWYSMSRGRFRARDGLTIDQALRAWVAGVAMNQALNWQARAFNRREVPSANPRRFEPAGEDPAPRYDAREVLSLAVRRLPVKLRPVLVLALRGFGATEIAIALNVSLWVAWRRLDEVRRRVAAIARGRS